MPLAPFDQLFCGRHLFASLDPRDRLETMLGQLLVALCFLDPLWDREPDEDELSGDDYVELVQFGPSQDHIISRGESDDSESHQDGALSR